MRNIFKYICIFILQISILCSCNADNIEQEEKNNQNNHTSSVNSDYISEVIKHSNINPNSDFAKTALNSVELYLTEIYSGNSEIESFEITDIEIDYDYMDFWINLNLSLNQDTYDCYDLLNNFLVIKTRTKINLFENIENPGTFPDYDLSEPMVWKIFVMYDPDDKYSWATQIGDGPWKHVDSSFGNYESYNFTDEELYEKFYE